MHRNKFVFSRERPWLPTNVTNFLFMVLFLPNRDEILAWSMNNNVNRFVLISLNVFSRICCLLFDLTKVEHINNYIDMMSKKV